MNHDAVLEGLLRLGQDDWIGLWLIVDDVEEELGLEDESEILEATVAMVHALLRHGFLAGDSPVHTNCVHFQPWSSQDPAAVIELIPREWAQRGDFPSWGDGPWFALPPRSRH